MSLLFGAAFIPLLKKRKAQQTILKYVEEHKSKNGTPTMGGLFFIFAAVLAFFIFGGAKGRVGAVSAVFGTAYMLTGFLDDFIKIRFRQNEGLKPYQKILFQVLVGVIAGVFAYRNFLTEAFVPFTKNRVDLGWGTIPFTALLFIALSNCVNLTDGLDGLASSSVLGFLLPFTLLIFLQAGQAAYLSEEEYLSVALLNFALGGALVGFLFFNTNRAGVFMGDTGSLALGGFLAAQTAFTGNAFYVPIFGVMFVVSGLSVIIQVLHFKRTKRRVFLMAPYHHHLQHKGISEAKISYIYMAVTLVSGLISLVNYL
ncbi:MAG: phospho-N-acetylmuramoyl-pentapeptide-transferase [Bacillota bacterium]|nr:MAG: phospho-N-acetylmuramoyl-pentapeptide-transferase [Bacillota bacterium]